MLGCGVLCSGARLVEPATAPGGVFATLAAGCCRPRPSHLAACWPGVCRHQHFTPCCNLHRGPTSRAPWPCPPACAVRCRSGASPAPAPAPGRQPRPAPGAGQQLEVQAAALGSPHALVAGSRVTSGCLLSLPHTVHYLCLSAAAHRLQSPAPPASQAPPPRHAQQLPLALSSLRMRSTSAFCFSSCCSLAAICSRALAAFAPSSCRQQVFGQGQSWSRHASSSCRHQAPG